MATTRGKTKSAARKTSSSRSRTSARQTARTAGDNEPGANLVNERASNEAAALAADHSDTGEKAAKLHPDVERLILGTDDGEPLSSVNSVPKAEGGLPADVLSNLRQDLETVRGQDALGQPGQVGHGVGTARVGEPMTDEEIAANEKEYAARTKA